MSGTNTVGSIVGSGEEFWELEAANSAAATDNHTAFTANFPVEVPVTDFSFNMDWISQLQGSGSILWYLSLKNNTDAVVYETTFSTVCTGSATITNHVIAGSINRSNVKKLFIAANKSGCVFSTSQATMYWNNALIWSTADQDVTTFSSKETELGDFISAAEGPQTSGANLGTFDFETSATNITISMAIGTTLFGYYSVSCRDSAIVGCGLNGNVGPRVEYTDTAGETCIVHVWQGYAGSGKNYVSVWKHVRNSNAGCLGSFRISGYIGTADDSTHYFRDHDVYFGNTFGKGGGDFSSTGSRPQAAPCYQCPMDNSPVKSVALVYPSTAGTLKKAPLAGAMSDNVNIDWNNAETVAAGYSAGPSTSQVFNLTRNTYWGNAIFFAVTAVNNTNTNPEECSDDNMPVFVGGNLAHVTRAETWRFSSTQRAITCLWLVKDFHRQEGNTLYNNGRNPDSLEFSVQITDWPDTWVNPGNDGVPYAIRNVQNFAGNKSEYLGCSTFNQANYCFGNMDTTGFQVPGLLETSRWTFCTFHGRGTETVFPNANSTALPGAVVFEARNGLVNTTATQPAPLPAGSPACTGTNATARANLSVEGNRASFSFTASGFHTLYANYTDVVPNARYVVEVYMNQTTRDLSFQTACVNVPDNENPNGTAFSCSVLASNDPSLACDEFSLQGQTCEAQGPGSGGLVRTFVFECATDRETTAWLHVTVFESSSGYTSDLNFASARENCLPVNTTAIRSTTPTLFWSKQGYNTLRFIVPSWAFSPTTDRLRFLPQMTCGSGETILTTADRVVNNTITTAAGLHANVTSFVLRDTATQGTCLTDRGIAVSVPPVEDLIIGLFTGIGLGSGTGKILGGILLLIAILLGCIYLYHRNTGAVPSGAFIAVIGIPTYLAIGYLGLWPPEVLILSVIGLVLAVVLFLRSRFGGGGQE